MHFSPVKTKRFEPPQDDLFAELDRSLPALGEGDILLVSSKVVAIDEGRCVEAAAVEKSAVVATEADLLIERPYWPTPLAISNHAFIGAAGIDESNGGGYLVLLPKDPFASAQRMHEHLCRTHGLERVGVILTDSRSLPLRYGASGVAIGWWGISPLRSHIGERDLFGRPLRYERSNVVDGLAAAATVLMGEVAEQTPIVIARSVPGMEFTTHHTREELFCPYAEDTFRILYERFLPPADSEV